MHSDRYRNVVLTVIAVCLSVLTIAQLAPPAAQAGTGQIEQMRQKRREAVVAAPHVPTSTRPLRYRIPWARHETSGVAGMPECATIVSVVNFGPNDTAVDVEFFSFSGLSMGMANRVVSAGHPDQFVTNTDAQLPPFWQDESALTPNFDGYAQVNADDPRIIVAAMMRCGDDDLTLPVTVTNIPAYPVGATVEFFQAGMPATWTPPMVEVPE